MRKSTYIFLFVLAVAANASSVTYAVNSYTTAFNSTYGTAGTRNGTSLGSCITCHNRADGNGGENSYGSAYGNSRHNFSTIEGLDSDSDGYSNIDEILAGSFPGDPGSLPQVTNDPPVANAGPDQTVNEGSLVTLDGSNSFDPDDGIASYLWTQTGGTAVTLSSPTAVQPRFTSPNVGTSGESLTFQLTVTDKGGLKSTDTSIVNVSWINLPPVADAGPDQTVNEGSLVTLDGSNSFDPDDGIASYLWTQTGGTAVTLSSPTAVQPRFTSPNVGTSGESLTFQLTVTDKGGLKSTDTSIVNVSWINLPPVADAGPDQTVNEGSLVTLDGSNSFDPDDGIASYLWTQTGGLTVTLSNPYVESPTFISPVVGSGGTALTFMLTVTDGFGQEATDTCNVNVTNNNLPPTADAGPNQTVDEGVTVTLNGSNSSDPDDGIASYLWTQTGGTGITLSGITAVQPKFTSPNVGPSGESLSFQLTVTDNGGLKSTDICVVNVSWVNLAPTANAGPDQTVDEGVTVRLNGSNSSDPDDGIASYVWTQTAGPQVTLSNATVVQPTFTASNVGTGGESLTFQLTVTDNGGLKSTDTCVVNVSWVNLAPTANAGPDQTVDEGVTVTLNGSNSSDPDDGIASYVWTQTAGPQVTLSNATVVQPTFTASNVGTGGESLTFQLTVTDNGGLKSTDTCVVNVSWVNLAPTANAGPDQTVDEGVTVTLNGSNSSDPDGAIASYLWEQTGGPGVTLSDTRAAQPTFVTPAVDLAGTTLTFRLTVGDNGDLQATDHVSVAIDDNGITGFPNDVLTMRTSTGESFGMKAVSGGNIISISVIDPSTIGDTSGKPENLYYGLFNLNLKVDTPGATATVSFYFTQSISDSYKWYKYTTSNGWIDYSASALFNPTRDQVTLTLRDGGLGDDDNMANGLIVDPSGPGTSPSASALSIVGNNWGGGGGCFISAVSYGSQVEAHQQGHLKFRDRLPLNNPIGKAFEQLYYLAPSHLKEFIAGYNTFRLLVRRIMFPPVGFDLVPLRLGPVEDLAFTVLFLVMMGTILLVYFGRTRRRG